MAEIIAPPFTDPTLATKKVQIAEDLWNTRDPERVAAAYTEDSQWRNRTEILDWTRGHSRVPAAQVESANSAIV